MGDVIEQFVSIDWGTTNFRMRLVEVKSMDILEAIESSEGIKTIYNQQEGGNLNKELFFLDFIKRQLETFESSIGEDIPIVISGMASSSIGLRELPYAQLPFMLSGSSLYTEMIRSSVLNNPVYLISGVRSETDVIRGEEVQIIGLTDLVQNTEPCIYILPGTHSKHLICSKGHVLDFKTYMTGELFEAIANNTILKNTLEHSQPSQQNMDGYKAGVLDAWNNDTLLNSLFKVRTNILLGNYTPTANYYYLSGLLIGEELKSLKHLSNYQINICASGIHSQLYLKALEVVNLVSKVTIVPGKVVDRSVVKGQLKVLKNILKNEPSI